MGISHYGKFLYFCRRMERLRNILVFFLVGTVLFACASAGVVHICTAYCAEQSCSGIEGHSLCCAGEKHKSEDCLSMENCTENDNDCSCINLKYDINYFFKKLDESGSRMFECNNAELPVFLAVCHSFPVSEKLSFRIPNAPPVRQGRQVLAMHSVLVI